MSLIAKSYKYSNYNSYDFINNCTITIVNARRVQIIVLAVNGDSERKYQVISGNVTYDTENATNLEVHSCGVQSIMCFVPYK